MASNDSRRRVYLLCRPIFSGNNALVRRHRKVKELVNGNGSLKPLLKDIGEARLVEILRDLLENRIFESELKAKVAFPELFRPSPIRDAQRQAFEIDAARSNAEVLEEITHMDSESPEVEDIEDDEPEETAEPDNTVIGDTGEALDGSPPAKKQRRQVKQLPSLYPSYLPYQTQHLLLSTAQQVLEECCFSFAMTSMPAVLVEKEWDCPAAVELTQWTKLFRRNRGRYQLRELPPELRAEEAPELLTMISNLRHTAVHRLPTTAKGISKLLESAMRLARILGDDLRAAQLEEVWSELNSKIKAMELNKNVLEDTVSCRLQEIQRQREELDRTEKELIRGMLKDDMDNKALVGQLLEDSVRGIFDKEEKPKGENNEEGNEKMEKEEADAEREKEKEQEGGEERDEGRSKGKEREERGKSQGAEEGKVNM